MQKLYQLHANVGIWLVQRSFKEVSKLQTGYKAWRAESENAVMFTIEMVFFTRKEYHAERQKLYNSPLHSFANRCFFIMPKSTNTVTCFFCTYFELHRHVCSSRVRLFWQFRHYRLRSEYIVTVDHCDRYTRVVRLSTVQRVVGTGR